MDEFPKLAGLKIIHPLSRTGNFTTTANFDLFHK